MQQQYLSKVKEQTVYIRLGGRTYSVRFYPFRDLMYCDIILGDEYVVVGQRVLPNIWLIPSYMTTGYGNMRFEVYQSDGDDYIWWEGFNTKFRLCLYTDEEIANLEATEDIGS